jgi:hypothetical protein
MTLRLELRPEVEAALTGQANAKGIPLDEHLQGLIEDFARTPVHTDRDTIAIRAALDSLAEMGKGLPHLPSPAFSRESIYLDHD